MMSLLLPDGIKVGFTVEYIALFFLLVFLVIVLRAFLPSNREHFEQVGELPLQDEVRDEGPSIYRKEK